MHTFAHKQKPTQEAKFVRSAKPSRAFSEQSRKVSPFLFLQCTIGNQEVRRLLQTNAEEHKMGSTTTPSTGLAHDFSRIPLHFKAHSENQPKLTSSTPGDPNEHEADRIADQVMRAPEQQLCGLYSNVNTRRTQTMRKWNIRRVPFGHLPSDLSRGYARSL